MFNNEDTMPKILLIDDDSQYRTLVRRMLEADGHEVYDAHDARSGHELFSTDRPDVVITDILMPGVDGIELIRRLRQEKRDVPIIAISGGGQCPPDLYLLSSQYLGATRTLSKPFRRDELLDCVKEVLSESVNESG
jgi:CheY-like chemotaxis protein